MPFLACSKSFESTQDFDSFPPHTPPAYLLVSLLSDPGEPDKDLNPKKKVWEQVQPDLRTDDKGVANYKGAAFEVAGKGVCKAPTMRNSGIR